MRRLHAAGPRARRCVAAALVAALSLGCGAAAPATKGAGEPAVEAKQTPRDRGRELLASQQVAEARAFYTARTEAAPDDAEAWHGLGAACFRAGDLACAASALERALSLAPDDPGVLSSLGLLRHREGRLEEARALLERAVAQGGGHGAAHNNLGLVLLAAGEQAAARRAFEAALAADPSDRIALENLGLLLLYHEGDPAAARPHLERRLQLMDEVGEPRVADDYRDVGLAALFSDDAGAAIGYLEQAQRMAPDRAELRFHLGMAYLAAEEYGAARPQLDAAWRSEPDNPLYANMLGRLLARMRRCAEALPPLQQAAAASPEDAEVQMALGVCHQARGAPDASRAAFTRACALGLQRACD